MSDIACTECAAGALTEREPALGPDALPTFESARADQVAQAARERYDGGLCCGEAVLAVVNDIAPDPLPPSVIRLGSGFCEGIGGAGCSCGALVGAVMAIGLLAGRDSADDEWEPSYYASGFLYDRFRDEFGSTSCRTIVCPFGDMDAPGRHEHCAMITAVSAGWVIEIAEQNGWL